MDNLSKIEYEWVYSPLSGIKAPFQVYTDRGNIEFRNGRIIATVNFEGSNWNESFGKYFDDYVRSVIDAISLLEHISLKVDGPSKKMGQSTIS